MNKKRNKILATLLTVAALLCTTGFAANAATKETSIASSKAKEVFAGHTVTVYDAKTPATYSGGTDWPITTYYFFSADNKKLGSISGQAMNSIMDKYRMNNNGSWDAPGNDGDWSKWFANMFNEYRGLSEGDVKKGIADLYDEYRYEVIRLTNVEREKAGLPALEINQNSMEFAQMRAEELTILYSHKRPDGTTMMYDGLHFAENIAWGQTSPQTVVEAWMNSPGHRRAILDDYSGYDNKIGVGCYKDANGRWYWTQEFVIWDANA